MDTDHGFAFRPDTQDEHVFREVVDGNVYRLPDRLPADALVVDIGLNIGGFAYAALTRGAGEVHGFEPDPDNFEAASRNLRRFGDRARLHRRAVWRSDRPAAALALHHLDPAVFSDGRERLTGCAHVLAGAHGDPGIAVPAVPLDRAIEEITRGGRRRVALLKIDCEGAEYPILLTASARTLGRIDAIVGEYHNLGVPGCLPDHPFARIPDDARLPGVDRFHADVLVAHLTAAGFDVTATPHPVLPRHIGHFFAARRDRPRAGVVRRLLGRLAS